MVTSSPALDKAIGQAVREARAAQDSYVVFAHARLSKYIVQELTSAEAPKSYDRYCTAEGHADRHVTVRFA